MKYIYIILMFLNSNICLSQLNWSYTNHQRIDYKNKSDNMPLKLKDSVVNFNKAMVLLEKDSITKAGMIFERIFFLDTTSKIGAESRLQLLSIEKQLKEIFINKIQGIWSEYECPSADIRYDIKTKRNQKSTKLKISSSNIVYVENSKNIFEKKYTLYIKFDWFYGTTAVYLLHDDDKKTIVYFLQSPTMDYIFDTIILKTSEMKYNDQKCYSKE